METYKLLDYLESNKKNHIKNYNDAVLNYRKKFEDRCRNEFDKMKNNENYVPKISENLNPPVNYIEQYDNAIAMLKMHIGPDIEIDEKDYKKFIKDEWEWSYNFLSSNSKYLGS